MQVSVLGTFQVWRNGRLLVPSAPKLRQVLALLAVNVNTVVSTDQIIEELWEERPPSSATTTLQTYIYHLRKLYNLDSRTRGPADSPSGTAPALYRSPNGYVLQLAEDAVDSAHFLRLAERARAQVDDGELETAADTMRAALQLWRGPALVDVTTGLLLRATTVWLEERRRGLTLQRIDADLHLRRHHEVIGELTGLVAQRPTDESLQSRLMLALYRAGRRFDALQVYQDARSALAEELGLEPLPELQRVHQAVLVADPMIEPPELVQTMTTSGSEGKHQASESHRPNQLPPDVVRLVGRHKELTALSQALSPDLGCAAVAVVDGPPGAGKSTLCVNFAHRIRPDYPDGQLYARLTDDAGEPVDPGQVLASFLRAAGYPTEQLPESVPELSSLFRSWSAGRKVLLVLDDAVDAEQIQPLLPTGAHCATLIAARRRFSHPVVAATIHLEAFDRGDALQLLTHVLGEQRIRTQMSAVDELIELCEGLPSALQESAAQLELKPHWPIRKHVDRLRGAAMPEPSSTAGIGTSRSVERTYRLLPADLRAAFRTLVGAERPLPLRAIAALLRADGNRAETLVEELVQFGLVEVNYVEDLDDFQYRVRGPFRMFLADAELAGWGSSAHCGPPRAA